MDHTEKKTLRNCGIYKNANQISKTHKPKVSMKRKKERTRSFSIFEEERRFE
jgi:hypothetical protein